MKLESAVEFKESFARVKVTFNLWAPFAFSLLLPVALSNKVVSDSGVTNVSEIVKPTLYEGLFVYLSKIILCSAFLTKVPLTKYTPALIYADEPVAVASVDCKVADSWFATNELTAPSAEMFSPFWKTSVTLSSPVCIYFTNNVIGSPPDSSALDDESAATAAITCAFTPEVAPVIILSSYELI